MIIPIRKPAPITSSDMTGERVIILKRELDRIVDDINRQTAELDRRIAELDRRIAEIEEKRD